MYSKYQKRKLKILLYIDNPEHIGHTQHSLTRQTSLVSCQWLMLQENIFVLRTWYTGSTLRKCDQNCSCSQLAIFFLQLYLDVSLLTHNISYTTQNVSMYHSSKITTHIHTEWQKGEDLLCLFITFRWLSV